MLPVKFLVTLTAIYNGTLYVARPLKCTHASITSDRSTNTTWTLMETDVLGDIPVFKILVKQKENGTVTFKIRYGYPSYTVETTWQTITHKTQSVHKEQCPNYNGCCISVVALSGVLVLIVSLLITAYFLAKCNVDFRQ